MHSRKLGAHSLSSRTPSTASSPSISTLDDDEDFIMTDTSSANRHLTLSIPRSAPSPVARRPNLSEIIANTAPPPYTLGAFTVFLSQNHCLENLEFIMDVDRYGKYWSKAMKRLNGKPLESNTYESDKLYSQWTMLIDAYVRTEGPRELNLPSDVRHALLNLHAASSTPPMPQVLYEAKEKIYALLEDSVLVSFLNSVSPMSAYPPSTSHESQSLTFNRPYIRSYDERSNPQSRTSHPHLPPHQRASAPSSLMSTLMHPRPFAHSRFNSQPTSSSASSPSSRITSGYMSGSDVLTDDSSTSSPSGINDPLTPPGTPPMSDYAMPDFDTAYYENGSIPSSTSHSPRTSRAEHSALATATKDSWKRVSSKLWPKKKSASTLREEQGVVEGGLF